VIASSTYPLDIAPARRIARAHGATLVWEVHDLWPLSPIQLGGMSPHHPFIMWLQRGENMACRDADLVVSLLPKADAHLREHGMAADKFVYVPNGIDPAEWSSEGTEGLPEGHAAAIHAARAKGHLLVAYAGTHGIANALDSMLDAAALLRDEPVSWLVVGSGPGKAALQHRVATEGLTNMAMLDPVSKAAIPTLLRAMDVLYIGMQSQPLYRFGVSPNKLMDYMMAARPVICAFTAGNDPMGEAGCGLTIAPEDGAALAAAIRYMRQLAPEERERMGRCGRGYVERNHLYAVLAQRFLDAVRERSGDEWPRP
jgi:glycosyltransferase involved in cell wall biosynthesis